MIKERSAEKRLRRIARRLGLNISRSRSSGGYCVDGPDGTALAGGYGTLTLGEAEEWLTKTGVQMRKDAAAGLAGDRGRYVLHIGDASTVLRTLPAETFQTCVTSPPYFQHRDYGIEGQIGQETTPAEFVKRLVDAFDQVKQSLRADGTLWIVIGDSFVSNPSTSTMPRAQQGNGGGRFCIPAQRHVDARKGKPNRATPIIRAGLPLKSLIGIPGRLIIGLQNRGWIFRSGIIWQKPASLPENVRDRPIISHEHVLLFAKGPTYFYNAAATVGMVGGNRSVWEFPVNKFRGDHHALMPVALAERCILIGSARGAQVLDPFAGLGTVGLAAIQHGRDATLIEFDPQYANRIKQRLG